MKIWESAEVIYPHRIADRCLFTTIANSNVSKYSHDIVAVPSLHYWGGRVNWMIVFIFITIMEAFPRSATVMAVEDNIFLPTIGLSCIVQFHPPSLET